MFLDDVLDLVNIFKFCDEHFLLLMGLFYIVGKIIIKYILRNIAEIGIRYLGGNFMVRCGSFSSKYSIKHKRKNTGHFGIEI